MKEYDRSENRYHIDEQLFEMEDTPADGLSFRDPLKRTENYEREVGAGFYQWREKLSSVNNLGDFLVLLQDKPGISMEEDGEDVARYITEHFDELFSTYNAFVSSTKDTALSKELLWELYRRGTSGVYIGAILSGFHPTRMTPQTNEQQSAVSVLLKKCIDFTVDDGNLSFEKHVVHEKGQKRPSVKELEERNDWSAGSYILTEEQMADLILLYAKFDIPVDSTFFIDLVERIPAGSANIEIAKVLEKEHVADSAQELFKRMHAVKDPMKQEAYSRVLYHLELGKIGIHENVITYLDTLKYRIPEDQSKGVDVARRITGDGKIGLFGGRRLVGFFELGDLKDPELERQVEVLEVSRELLFADPNTPDDIRQQFLADYTDFYEKVFGEVGGVRMSDLTLREQMHMYQTWKEMTPEEWNEVLAIKEKFGYEGIKTFAAIQSSYAGKEALLRFAQQMEAGTTESEYVLRAFVRGVEDIDATIAQVQDIYGQQFYNKTVDAWTLRKALLDRHARLFADGVNQMNADAQTEEKQKQLHALVQEFEMQQKLRDKEVAELVQIGGALNAAYADVVQHSVYGNLIEEMQAWRQEYLEQSEKPLPEDRLDHEVRKVAQFDSERIRHLIETSKAQYEVADEDIEAMEGVYGEQGRNILAEQAQEERRLYEPLVRQLERLLPLQASYERRMDRLVYGIESAALPKDIFASAPASETEPLPQWDASRPVYFPVGISSNWKQWEAVFDGRQEAAKPIDAYAYLFGLQQIGEPVELVVADTVQTANYTRTGELTQGEAERMARRIGREEARTYQQIIDTFGLHNIRVVSYEQSIQASPENTYDQYVSLCRDLAGHPLLKDAFLGAVQASAVGEDAGDTTYAIDEIAYILSHRGTKISHVNEARYDMVAAFIENLEQRVVDVGLDVRTVFSQLPTDTRGVQLTEVQQSLVQIYNDLLEGLRAFVNTKKSALKDKKDQAAYEYYNAAGSALQNMHPVKADRKKVSRAEKKTQQAAPLAYHFVPPTTDSKSFGWRSAGDKGMQEVIKFKEPYSTYFYSGQETVFTDTEQVVAAPTGHIGGKILTMGKKQQVEYAQRVIAPMMAEYTRVLAHAPATYFSRVGKSQDELQEEMASCETLSDALKFIQQYIVAPTVREKTSHGADGVSVTTLSAPGDRPPGTAPMQQVG